MYTEVTKENFDEEVKNYDGKVLVDFWAEWCAPCMMLSPRVDEVAEEEDDIKVCKVNCDVARDLALEFGIISIPTLLVFDHGEIVNKSVGLVEKQDILNLIK